MDQILVVPDFALVLYLGQAKRAVLFFEREAEEPAAERRLDIHRLEAHGHKSVRLVRFRRGRRATSAASCFCRLQGQRQLDIGGRARRSSRRS